METKLFEVRDAATFLPVLCVRLGTNVLEVAALVQRDSVETRSEIVRAERFLMAKAGFGKVDETQYSFIMMWSLQGGLASYDLEDWTNRTHKIAHGYIDNNWDKLESGAIIDVEFILKETKEPKVSERFIEPDFPAEQQYQKELK